MKVTLKRTLLMALLVLMVAIFMTVGVGAAAMTGTYADDAAAIEAGAAAKITDNGATAYYAKVSDALDAVQDGQTITLLNATGTAEGGTEITFDKAISFTVTGTAPNYAFPIVTFKNATVTFSNAEILTAELDARQNATINVVNTTVHGHGGNEIVKSYFNGAINVSGSSVIHTMQVTTMGYITLSDTARINAVWKTNVYGNGMIVVKDDAVLATGGLNVTGQDYEDRDNTDTERVGKPATIVVDGGTLLAGEVYAEGGSDYGYNAGKYGIFFGTVDGKSALLNIKNGGAVALKQVAAGTSGKEYAGVVTFGAGATVLVDGGSLQVACQSTDGTAKLTNNGTVYVTGSSAVSGTVTGNGWFYMDNASLGTDTVLHGAKVGFINGTNAIVGSTIDDGWFSVGLGQGADATAAADFATANGITLGDVTVNVSDDATVGASGGDYRGWIGSAYSADKTVNKYVLNVNNSQTSFGYLHISLDGALNVTGETSTDNKFKLDGSTVDFYAGTLIINGAATFDDCVAWGKFTKLAVDISASSDTPAVLNIVNGASYEASIHNGSNTGSALVFYGSKYGVVNIDNGTLDITGATTVNAKSAINVLGGATLKTNGKLTNNGTITVKSGSLNVPTFTGNNIATAADGAILKDTYINGSLVMQGDVEIVTGLKLTGDVIVNKGGELSGDAITFVDNSNPAFTLTDGATLALNCAVNTTDALLAGWNGHVVTTNQTAIRDNLNDAGYAMSEKEAGVWFVGVPVAVIGTSNYQTLAEAVAAANEGDTITLVANASVPSTIVVSANITIDGGNFTITSDATEAVFKLNASLDINNASIINNVADSPVFLLGADVDLTVGSNTAINSAIILGGYDTVSHTHKVTVSSVALSAALEAEGYYMEDNLDGTYTISEHAVAKIGNTLYHSFADALAAAVDGDTIIILKNLELTDTVVIDKKITIYGHFNLINSTATEVFSLGENASLIINCGITKADGAKVLAAWNGQAVKTDNTAVRDMLNAEGYAMVEETTGVWAVKTAMAKIGAMNYASFADALAAAVTGDEIVLLADATLTETADVAITLTISGGYKITSSASTAFLVSGNLTVNCAIESTYGATGAAFTMSNSGTVAINGNVTTAGKILAGYAQGQTVTTTVEAVANALNTEGYALELASGVYTVVTDAPEAVDAAGKYYETLEKALAAGATEITLLSNVTVEATIEVNGTLTIKGDYTLTSTAASAFKLADGAKLNINCALVATDVLDATGGWNVSTTVKAVAEQLNAEIAKTITEGTGANAITINLGYALELTGGVYTVVSNEPEAAIGGWNYKTLEKAIASATNGQTIDMLRSIETSSNTMNIVTNITLDGHNFKLKSTNGTGNAGLRVVDAQAVIKNLKLETTAADAFVMKHNSGTYVKATLINCEVTSARYGLYVFQTKSADLIVENTQITTTSYGVYFNAANASVTLTDTTVDSDVDSVYATNTSFSASKLANLTLNGNTKLIAKERGVRFWKTAGTVTVEDSVSINSGMHGVAGYGSAIALTMRGNATITTTANGAIDFEKADSVKDQGSSVIIAGGVVLNGANYGIYATVDATNVTVDVMGMTAYSAVHQCTRTSSGANGARAWYFYDTLEDTLDSKPNYVDGNNVVTLFKSTNSFAGVTLAYPCTINGNGCTVTAVAGKTAFTLSDDITTLALNDITIVADAILGNYVQGKNTVTTNSEAVANTLNAEGYALVKSGDVWTITAAKGAAAAQVNGWNYATFAEAYTAAPANGTITLLNNIDFGSTTFEIKKTLTIVGNSSIKITAANSANAAIRLLEGADLTLDGVVMETTKNWCLDIGNRGTADANDYVVVLKNSTLHAAKEGIQAPNATGNVSITFDHSTLTNAASTGIYVFKDTASFTAYVLNGSVINTKGTAISAGAKGNGMILVDDSDVTGNTGFSVYFKATTTITVRNDSHVTATGDKGIFTRSSDAIKSGTITVSDTSSIKATGTESGDYAILLDTAAVSVIVKDTAVVSSKTNAIYVKGTNGAEISVEGNATLDGSTEVYLAANSLNTAVNFSKSTKYEAYTKAYVGTNGADVAYYLQTSFATAITEAQKSASGKVDEITLLKNVTLSSTVTISKNVTIIGNGKDEGCLTINASVSPAIKANAAEITFQDLRIVNTAAKGLVFSADVCTLTLNNTHFETNGGDVISVEDNTADTLEINFIDSEILANTNCCMWLGATTNKVTVNIQGSTMTAMKSTGMSLKANDLDIFIVGSSKVESKTGNSFTLYSPDASLTIENSTVIGRIDGGNLTGDCVASVTNSTISATKNCAFKFGVTGDLAFTVVDSIISTTATDAIAATNAASIVMNISGTRYVKDNVEHSTTEISSGTQALYLGAPNGSIQLTITGAIIHATDADNDNSTHSGNFTGEDIAIQLTSKGTINATITDTIVTSDGGEGLVLNTAADGVVTINGNSVINGNGNAASTEKHNAIRLSGSNLTLIVGGTATLNATTHSDGAAIWVHGNSNLYEKTNIIIKDGATLNGNKCAIGYSAWGIPNVDMSKSTKYEAYAYTATYYDTTLEAYGYRYYVYEKASDALSAGELANATYIDNVVLLKDVSITDKITLGKDVTVYGNGHSLTYTGTSTSCDMITPNYHSLTVYDMTFVNGDENGNSIVSQNVTTAGHITLEFVGCTFVAKKGIVMWIGNTTTASLVTDLILTDCVIGTEANRVVSALLWSYGISGSGESAVVSTLTITGTTIYTTGYAINVKGANFAAPSVITVTDSCIDTTGDQALGMGDWDNVLTINVSNSTLKGKMEALEMRGTITATVKNSTLISTHAGTSNDDNNLQNNTRAIYAGKAVTLTMADCTLISNEEGGLGIYSADGSKNDFMFYNVKITGYRFIQTGSNSLDVSITMYDCDIKTTNNTFHFRNTSAAHTKTLNLTDCTIKTGYVPSTDAVAGGATTIWGADSGSSVSLLTVKVSCVDTNITSNYCVARIDGAQDSSITLAGGTYQATTSVLRARQYMDLTILPSPTTGNRTNLYATKEQVINFDANDTVEYTSTIDGKTVNGANMTITVTDANFGKSATEPALRGIMTVRASEKGILPFVTVSITDSYLNVAYDTAASWCTRAIDIVANNATVSLNDVDIDAENMGALYLKLSENGDVTITHSEFDVTDRVGVEIIAQNANVYVADFSDIDANTKHAFDLHKVTGDVSVTVLDSEIYGNRIFDGSADDSAASNDWTILISGSILHGTGDVFNLQSVKGDLDITVLHSTLTSDNWTAILATYCATVKANFIGTLSTVTTGEGTSAVTTKTSTTTITGGAQAITLKGAQFIEVTVDGAVLKATDANTTYSSKTTQNANGGYDQNGEDVGIIVDAPVAGTFTISNTYIESAARGIIIYTKVNATITNVEVKAYLEALYMNGTCKALVRNSTLRVEGVSAAIPNTYYQAANQLRVAYVHQSSQLTAVDSYFYYDNTLGCLFYLPDSSTNTISLTGCTLESDAIGFLAGGKAKSTVITLDNTDMTAGKHGFQMTMLVSATVTLCNDSDVTATGGDGFQINGGTADAPITITILDTSSVNVTKDSVQGMYFNNTSKYVMNIILRGSASINASGDNSNGIYFANGSQCKINIEMYNSASISASGTGESSAFRSYALSTTDEAYTIRITLNMDLVDGKISTTPHISGTYSGIRMHNHHYVEMTFVNAYVKSGTYHAVWKSGHEQSGLTGDVTQSLIASNSLFISEGNYAISLEDGDSQASTSRITIVELTNCSFGGSYTGTGNNITLTTQSRHGVFAKGTAEGSKIVINGGTYLVDGMMMQAQGKCNATVTDAILYSKGTNVDYGIYMQSITLELNNVDYKFYGEKAWVDNGPKIATAIYCSEGSSPTIKLINTDIYSKNYGIRSNWAEKGYVGSENDGNCNNVTIIMQDSSMTVDGTLGIYFNGKATGKNVLTLDNSSIICNGVGNQTYYTYKDAEGNDKTAKADYAYAVRFDDSTAEVTLTNGSSITANGNNGVAVFCTGGNAVSATITMTDAEIEAGTNGRGIEVQYQMNTVIDLTRTTVTAGYNAIHRGQETNLLHTVTITLTDSTLEAGTGNGVYVGDVKEVSLTMTDSTIAAGSKGIQFSNAKNAASVTVTSTKAIDEKAPTIWAKGSHGIEVQGPGNTTITLTNIYILAKVNGVHRGNNATTRDLDVTLTDCRIIATNNTNGAIYLGEDGADAFGGKLMLTIIDCELYGNMRAMAVTGRKNAGSVINIFGSTLGGKYSYVNPANVNETLTISAPSDTAILIKGAITLNINQPSALYEVTASTKTVIQGSRGLVIKDDSANSVQIWNLNQCDIDVDLEAIENTYTHNNRPVITIKNSEITSINKNNESGANGRTIYLGGKMHLTLENTTLKNTNETKGCLIYMPDSADDLKITLIGATLESYQDGIISGSKTGIVEIISKKSETTGKRTTITSHLGDGIRYNSATPDNSIEKKLTLNLSDTDITAYNSTIYTKSTKKAMSVYSVTLKNCTLDAGTNGFCADAADKFSSLTATITNCDITSSRGTAIGLFNAFVQFNMTLTDVSVTGKVLGIDATGSQESGAERSTLTIKTSEGATKRNHVEGDRVGIFIWRSVDVSITNTNIFSNGLCNYNSDGTVEAQSAAFRVAGGTANANVTLTNCDLTMRDLGVDSNEKHSSFGYAFWISNGQTPSVQLTDCNLMVDSTTPAYGRGFSITGTGTAEVVLTRVNILKNNDSVKNDYGIHIDPKDASTKVSFTANYCFVQGGISAILTTDYVDLILDHSELISLGKKNSTNETSVIRFSGVQNSSLKATNTTFTQNWIDAATVRAIWSSNGTFRFIELTDCTITMNSTKGEAIYKSGSHFTAPGKETTTDITLTRCEITSPGVTLKIDHSGLTKTTIEITDSELTSNTTNALVISSPCADGLDVTIDGSKITAGGADTMTFDGVTGALKLKVTDSTLVSNNWKGVYAPDVSSAEIEIDNSTINADRESTAKFCSALSITATGNIKITVTDSRIYSGINKNDGLTSGISVNSTGGNVTISVTDSTVSGTGHAIGVNGGGVVKLTIDGSVLQGSRPETSTTGNAILVKARTSSEIKVTNSSRLTSSDHVITVQPGNDVLATVTIEDSYLESYSRNSGNGMWLNVPSNITIKNSTLKSAKHSGFTTAKDATIYVEGSTIMGGTAGNAILMRRNSYVTIIDSQLSSTNEAIFYCVDDASKKIVNDGGAKFESSLILDGSTVTSNKSAINLDSYHYGTRFELSDSDAIASKNGYGLHFYGTQTLGQRSVITVDNCYIEGYNVGILMYYAVDLTIRNSDLMSHGKGYGTYSDTSVVRFSSNTSNGVFKATNSTFTQNYVDATNVQAIFSSNGTMTYSEMVGCTITVNGTNGNAFKRASSAIVAPASETYGTYKFIDCIFTSPSAPINFDTTNMTNITVEIINTSVTTDTNANALYFGNNSVAHVELTVKGSSLKSGGDAIKFYEGTEKSNYTNAFSGTVDLTIEDSSLIATTYGAVYMPRVTGLSLSVKDSYIEGNSFGLYMTGGNPCVCDKFEVINSTVIGKGSYGIRVFGNNVTGEKTQLIIDNCYVDGYMYGAWVRYAADVTIEDSTLVSQGGGAGESSVFRISNNDSNVILNATNTEFIQNVTDATAVNAIWRSNGSLTWMNLENCKVIVNGGNTSCHGITFGGNAFVFPAAEDFGTFNLINCEVKAPGHAVQFYNAAMSEATLNIIGGTYVSTGAMAVRIECVATANIYGGTFISSAETLVAYNDATVNVYGGYFETSNGYCVMNVRQYAVLNIYGGRIVSKTPSTSNDSWYSVLSLGAGDADVVDQSVINVYGGHFEAGEHLGQIFRDLEGRALNLYSMTCKGAQYILTDGTPGEGILMEYDFGANTYSGRSPVMYDGAQLRLVQTGKGTGGIRFVTKIDKNTLDYAKFMTKDDESITYGTLIVPLDYLMDEDGNWLIGDFSVASLEVAGMKYLNIVAKNGITQNADGSITLLASISEIKEQNYDRKFAAIGYVKYDFNGMDQYLYSAFDPEDNARSLKEIASKALNDVSETQNATYRYEIVDGFYSRYTDEQRELLAKYVGCQVQEEILKAPTATEAGLKRVTCTVCGTYYEEVILPLGEEEITASANSSKILVIGENLAASLFAIEDELENAGFGASLIGATNAAGRFYARENGSWCLDATVDTVEWEYVVLFLDESHFDENGVLTDEANTLIAEIEAAYSNATVELIYPVMVP